MASSETIGAASIFADPFQGVNVRDPAFRADPFPALAKLRATAPITRLFGAWRLARYHDCVRLLREVPTSVRLPQKRQRGQGEGPARAGTEQFMLHQDPPAHTRLRKLVAKAFTPKAIEQLRAKVEKLAEELVRCALDKVEIDIIADLALPIPATVTCEMIGVPVEDRDRLTQWTSQLTNLLAADAMPRTVLDAAMLAQRTLGEYVVDLVAERRRTPKDDILSDLIRAEEAGDRLTPEELVSQTIGLLSAGFETTIGLIANGVRQLVLHPGELAKLRANPALIGTAVEECLRYDGPVMQTARVLREPTVFGDVTIPQGAEVIAMLASANRDPAKFPNAESFDVARHPNEHLAFGGGLHFCQGAFLARMEAQVAIGTLVQQTTVLELDNAPIDWGRSLFRVPRRLPLRARAA
jgi:hypothetical protein